MTQAYTAGGGASSHMLPNHVIGKRTVNTTLGKGHHAQTRRTGRHFLIFHMIAVRKKNVYYYF